MTANPSVILCGFDPNSGYSYSGQILSTLLRYSYNDYINDQKDQYIFDTEKVMDLLAFCKEMGGRIVLMQVMVEIPLFPANAVL